MLQMAIIMIKPDALQRNLAEHVLSLVGMADLHILATEIIQLNEQLIRAFQPVMNEPSEFGEQWKQEVVVALTATPVVVLLVHGEDAIARSNSIKRAVRSQYAPGEHYRTRVIYNLMHAADSPDEVDNHLKLFFPEWPSTTAQPAQTMNHQREAH